MMIRRMQTQNDDEDDNALYTRRLCCREHTTKRRNSGGGGVYRYRVVGDIVYSPQPQLTMTAVFARAAIVQ